MSTAAPHNDTDSVLPRTAIGELTQPLLRYLHVESTSGILLLISAVIALALANSPFGDAFTGFWKTKVGFTFGAFEFKHSLKHLINDGLMVIFFFVIGMEVKREMVLGELADIRKAALPVAAAIGGMMGPAAIFIALQWGQPGVSGWGVPMATDIAFVVGCMALLGPRVPYSLKIVILSLAIVDDIGAILVIAIGYTDHLNLTMLTFGILCFVLVSIAARSGIRSYGVYTFLGIVTWFFFHESGIHATIAGVVLGLMTPSKPLLPTTAFRKFLRRADDILHGEWEGEDHKGERVIAFQNVAREIVSPLENLETRLHPWVSFVIMPLFALANSGVKIDMAAFTDAMAVAVAVALIIGKPLGITLLSFVAVKLGLAKLPEAVSWGMLFAGACLAGIGFTMALFIAGLAFSGPALDVAKIGVMTGSAASAVVGMLLLRRMTRNHEA